MGNVLRNSEIRLRALELSDVDFLYSIENDPDEWESSVTVTPRSKYLLNEFIVNSSNDFFIDNQIRVVIERLSDGVVLGVVDLFDYNAISNRAELGVFILRQYRHKGYARQAVELMLEYARQFLRLFHFYLYVRTDNEYAVKLFQNTGFSISGTLREWFSFKGVLYDAYIMQCILDNKKDA